MFKHITLVLFSAILMAQEHPSLAQQLQEVEAEEENLFSSFDKIKKQREKQEMEEERIIQENLKYKKELEEKKRVEQIEIDRIESEARLDTMRANAVQHEQVAEEKRKMAALEKAEASRKAELEKAKARKKAKAKKQAKARKQAKAKKEAKLKARARKKAREQGEVKKGRAQAAQSSSQTTQKPKKVSAQDHLNSILNVD